MPRPLIQDKWLLLTGDPAPIAENFAYRGAIVQASSLSPVPFAELHRERNIDCHQGGLARGTLPLPGLAP